MPTSVAGSEGKLIADDGRASVGGQLLGVKLHVRHARSSLVLAASLQNKMLFCKIASDTLSQRRNGMMQYAVTAFALETTPEP